MEPYYFEFFGQRDNDDSYLQIEFRLNSQIMSLVYTPPLQQYLTTSSAKLLQLKAGDKVDFYKLNGALYANSGYQSYFSGWLIDEDLK